MVEEEEDGEEVVPFGALADGEDEFVSMPAVKLFHEFSHPGGGSFDASFRAARETPRAASSFMGRA